MQCRTEAAQRAAYWMSAAILCAASLACEQRDAAKAPAAVPGVATSAPVTLALVTSRIDTSETVGGWLARHPGDVLSDSVPLAARRRFLCRVADAQIQLGGRRYRRSALFNLPQPPDGEALPDTAGLARSCHLRAIWLVAAVPDSARAAALVDSLSRAISGALGGGEARADMSTGGFLELQLPRSWIGVGSTVVAGAAPVVRGEEGSGPAVGPWRVVIASFAPASGLDRYQWDARDIDDDGEADAERDAELAAAESALRVAGIPALDTVLRPLIATARDSASTDTERSPAVDSLLVRGARLAREAGAHLGGARASAALFAADVAINETILAIGSDSSTWDDKPIREALGAVGAPFDVPDERREYRYSRALLRDAYRADSLTQGGGALAALLRHGWQPLDACGEELERRLNAIVAEGEHGLARGSSDPMVHYHLGIAYAEVVTQADGRDEDPTDRRVFAPPLVAARARAIEHLRVAMPGLRDRRLRRHAWRVITTLALGNAPRSRFRCVND